MELSKTLGIVTMAIYFWPLLVPLMYLLFRWGVIDGKFWFCLKTTLVGYALMFGIPLLVALLINVSVGKEGAIKALGSPSLTWFVQYYWLIMAVIALVLVSLPIFATHSIYKKQYAN